MRRRERSQENMSLKIKYVRLQAEVKWMRDVELVRLERSVLSLQDALAHVLEAVAPPILAIVDGSSYGVAAIRPVSAYEAMHAAGAPTGAGAAGRAAAAPR